MRRSAVIFCLLAILLTACGLKLPDDLGLPTELTGSEPRTLVAATAAAQERSDRFMSQDFAGAWMISSKQFQAAVTQTDYVAFQQTCTTSSDFLPVVVTGVRLDGDDQAIVRSKDLMGTQDSVTMTYEDGKWVQAPADYWLEHAGWTAEQLTAERMAAGKCSGDQTPTVMPTTTATTTTTTTPPAANARTIDELLADSPFARERPIVSGLKDQGYGYLDYELVSMAWDRTCRTFGGAQGASEIAVNDARTELLGMQFTPAEADAIIGIALEVHGSTGIEGCG